MKVLQNYIAGNIRHSTLAIILYLLTVSLGIGQQSESSLVDEFQNAKCDDMWARLDNFVIQIQNNPGVIATVEIAGKENQLRDNLYWESMIHSYLQSRGITGNQIKITRTALAKERLFRFWLTHPGASLPSIETVDWSMQIPSGTKPYVFTNRDSYAVELTVCIYVDELALLSSVLASNPKARLNVVLIVRSNREYVTRKRKVLKELVGDYDIPMGRIRMFKKIRVEPNPYGIKPDAEYWLLP